MKRSTISFAPASALAFVGVSPSVSTREGSSALQSGDGAPSPLLSLSVTVCFLGSRQPWSLHTCVDELSSKLASAGASSAGVTRQITTGSS